MRLSKVPPRNPPVLNEIRTYNPNIRNSHRENCSVLSAPYIRYQADDNEPKERAYREHNLNEIPIKLAITV